MSGDAGDMHATAAALDHDEQQRQRRKVAKRRRT
jgi:hypothetical protein